MSDDDRGPGKSGKREIDIQKWLLPCMGLAAIVFAIFLFNSSRSKNHVNVWPATGESNSQKSNAGLSDQAEWVRRLSTASASIAEKILPAVVSIRVSRDEIVTDDEELTAFFGQLPIPKSTDKGSGFFVRSDGWIVTNYHVVRQAKKIEIVQANGEISTANMEAYDTASDIAMLRIEATNRPTLTWASQPPTTGGLVWVAGSPFGLDGSLSMGIISAIHRRSLSGSPMRDYLQTDAVVNPGHSGGPVVNPDGEVVGVASVILGDEYRGIGFALPSTTAKSVSDQLIESGAVVQGWIGAQFGQLTAERARRTGIDELRGAYVERVTGSTSKPSPAEQAGLRVGDICVEINDVVVESQFDVGRSIAMMKPQEIARLKIIRNGSSMTIEIVVSEKR